MSALEFMRRLAALVPPPRLHLIGFHGVLAPNARLRAAIVPQPAKNSSAPSPDLAQAPGSSAAARISWAGLLKRVFQIDVEHCPHCCGKLKIIAAIEDPALIVAILTHLGLPKRGRGPVFPSVAPRRDPRRGTCRCCRRPESRSPQSIPIGAIAQPRVRLDSGSVRSSHSRLMGTERISQSTP